MLTILKSLTRCESLKHCYHSMQSFANEAVYRLSPVMLAKWRYHSGWGRWPDFDHPQTYDEKLLWLMLYWQHPLKTQCADKYTVRAYVQEKGLEHVLPKLFGVYATVAEIDFEALPNRFVLKCTHGCKCNVFCEDKQHLDVEETKRNLNAWLKIDFSMIYGEIQYAGMRPRIICEEFLEEPGARLPTDYKVHCFNSKAHCTMVCGERTPNGKPRLDFYDRDWKTKLPYSRLSFEDGRILPKPAAYDEIIAASETLAKPFPFVRVDFYSINGRPVLGEMTFTPGACVSASYMTELSQRELGPLIRLPGKLLK